MWLALGQGINNTCWARKHWGRVINPLGKPIEWIR